GPGFAAAHHPPVLDVPGRQVLQRSAAFVLRRYSAASPRSGFERRVFANTGLDAGLLIAAEDVVEGVAPFPLVVTRVQIQSHRRLFTDVGRGREAPVFGRSGLDGVSVEDLPDDGASDRLVQLVLGALARSVVDCRLSGLPVLATTSQRMDTTMALSRGGKDR